MKQILMKVAFKKRGFSELKQVSSNIDATIKHLIGNGMDKGTAIEFVHDSVNRAYLRVCKQLLEEYVGIYVESLNYRYLLDDSVGCYNSFYNEIKLTEKYALMYLIKYGNRRRFIDSIDTMLHEYRHAWQERYAKELKENYVDFGDDYKAYHNHPAEKDARAYAKKHTKKFIKVMESNIDLFLEAINNSVLQWINQLNNDMAMEA